MRKVVPFVLLLAVGACGTPARWEKPGVSPEGTVADITDCRRAASQEAFLYSYGLPPPLWPYPYRRSSLYWLQYEESQRFYAENRLTAFCMRNKGYELVPIPKTQG